MISIWSNLVCPHSSLIKIIFPNVCQRFVLLNIYIYKYSLPIICIQNLKVHQEFTTQSLIFMILMIYHWNVPHNTCCLFSKKSFCLLVLAKQMTLASSLRPLRICHNLSSFLGEVAPRLVGWSLVWLLHFDTFWTYHQQTWSILI